MKSFDLELKNILRKYYGDAPIDVQQALKEAIDKHIIGEDREYMKYEMCPHGCGPQYSCSCDSAEFSIKAKQRQALWGKEGEENG